MKWSVSLQNKWGTVKCLNENRNVLEELNDHTHYSGYTYVLSSHSHHTQPQMEAVLGDAEASSPSATPLSDLGVTPRPTTRPTTK